MDRTKPPPKQARRTADFAPLLSEEGRRGEGAKRRARVQYLVLAEAGQLLGSHILDVPHVGRRLLPCHLLLRVSRRFCLWPAPPGRLQVRWAGSEENKEAGKMSLPPLTGRLRGTIVEFCGTFKTSRVLLGVQVFVWACSLQGIPGPASLSRGKAGPLLLVALQGPLCSLGSLSCRSYGLHFFCTRFPLSMHRSKYYPVAYFGGLLCTPRPVMLRMRKKLLRKRLKFRPQNIKLSEIS